MKDGKFAAGVATPTITPESFAGTASANGASDDQKRRVAGELERGSIEWNHEGVKVGWLVPPANGEPRKKYPMVMLIHCGSISVNEHEWAQCRKSRDIRRAFVRGYYCSVNTRQLRAS